LARLLRSKGLTFICFCELEAKMYFKKTSVPKDLLQNKYLVADRDTIWCIDSTFPKGSIPLGPFSLSIILGEIAAGSLILVVDLATRLIVGHCYLHGKKHNEFSTEDAIELLQRCLKARQITEKSCLILHSDRGGPKGSSLPFSVSALE
jgi:hypothetical protein